VVTKQEDAGVGFYILEADLSKVVEKANIEFGGHITTTTQAKTFLHAGLIRLK